MLAILPLKWWDLRMPLSLTAIIVVVFVWLEWFYINGELEIFQHSEVVGEQILCGKHWNIDPLESRPLECRNIDPLKCLPGIIYRPP